MSEANDAKSVNIQANVRRGHILIVDDHATNRLKLSLAVKNLGHTTELAEHGLQALEMLRARPFDLVLLDILMPQLDGYRVLERMKQDSRLRDIPTIVISTLEEMQSVVACIELGAEDFLPKSFEPVLLRARISACLEKKQLRDAVKQQLDFIRDAFGKYVPASVAAAIVERGEALRSVRTQATILYSDIEGFTGLAETRPPEQVLQMLNDYFPAVIEPIVRNNGVVNQFQGDAMLVTFNVPLADPAHADRALRAALGVQQVLASTRFASLPLRTRIGISSGEVVAGNIGTEQRCNYTVLGDAVNLAARLEQLNKEYGTSILISAGTAAQLKDSYPLVNIGDVQIRGKRDAVQIFKLDPGEAA